MPRLAITDLSGSLNQGVAPSEIASNEFTAIENWYQFGSRLRRRGGMRRLTSDPFDEAITGILYYAPESEPINGVDVMVASSTMWGRYSAGTIYPVPTDSGLIIAPSTRRWSMFQYKNIAYGIRDRAGLVRSDGNFVGPAGIEAPGTAPVLADNATGVIPAADFVGVYTYYNSLTNLESDPSPASNTLSHAGSKSIDWSALVASANAQVDTIRLYRSLPDQTGEYFFVGEVANGVTTFNDNVLAQDLGDAASFTNDVPPDDLISGDVWVERLFCHNGSLLFHSEDGTPEAFDPDAFIPIFPDDGHPIRAVHAHGDRLIIGKTNKVHYLVGSGPATFQLLTLSDRHGCISHHSMQSAEGNLFWLGQDNVYRSDGNTVAGIASIKLRTIIENLDETQAENAFATVFPQLGWYVLVIPGYAQLVYNYRTDAWTTIPTAADIHMIGDFFTSDLVQEMFASDDDGHLYLLNDPTYGRDDDADSTRIPIAASFETRDFASEAVEGGVPGSVHTVQRVGLLTERIAATVDLAILSEGVVMKSRTDLGLDLGPRWKVYALSTMHSAQTRSRLRVEYSDSPFIEIEGFFIDLEPMARPSMLSN